MLDSILEQIANYQSKLSSSTGQMGQGTYVLKPKYWTEFEGRNFLQYSAEELQEAMSKFKVVEIMHDLWVN